MIGTLITYLTQKFQTFNYLQSVYGLAGVEDGDNKYLWVYQNGEKVLFNLDTHQSCSLFLMDGKVTTTQEASPLVANEYEVKKKYPFKALVYIQANENVDCYTESQKIADSIQKSITGFQKEILASTQLTEAYIEVTGTDFDRDAIYERYYSSGGLQEKDILIEIEFDFVVSGNQACYVDAPCDDDDFVFSFDAPLTFCEKVNDCLGISEGGDEDLVLNQQGDWVAQSGGGIQLRLYDENPVNEVTPIASGVNAVAIGSGTVASGDNSFAEGENTIASGAKGSHAEGSGTTASGIASHSEGSSTTASGQKSHAEGDNTIASGENSHSEGEGTTASGHSSHAEGENTLASGLTAHAEGAGTTASGVSSHAEGGGSTASGDFSCAQNQSTKAESYASTSIGAYNIGGGDPDTWVATDPLFEIGNGADDNNRNNALTVYKNADAEFDASIYMGKQGVDGAYRFTKSGGDLLVEKREGGSWVTKVIIG